MYEQLRGSLTARIDGMNPGSGYQPNHEWGNVLSYSPWRPANISTTIKSDYVNNLGSNYTEMWVTWTDMQDSRGETVEQAGPGASSTCRGGGSR